MSSWAVTTSMGDKQPAGVFAKRHCHGRSSLFCVLGRRYMCGKKPGKGVAGKGAEQVVKVVKRFELKQWGAPSHATN